METCKGCRFYFSVDKDGSQGECRLEPPKLFVLPGRAKVVGLPSPIELRSLFPPVMPGAWCGQYVKGFEAEKSTKTINLAEEE